MAKKIVPDPAQLRPVPAQLHERDFKITFPESGGYVIEGIGVWLEIECFAPEDLLAKGGDFVSWREGDLRFEAQRVFHDDLTLAQKDFLAAAAADPYCSTFKYWRVQCWDGTDHNCMDGRSRRLVTRELEQMLYESSEAGLRQRHLGFERYAAACSDKAFQAFKAKFIPKRKPGRPAKRSGAMLQTSQ